jgi:DNA polymerase III, beta subunit (EC 2.7.7.7)
MFLKVRKEDVIDGLLKAANIIPSKTGAAYLRTVWLKAEGGRHIHPGHGFEHRVRGRLSGRDQRRRPGRCAGQEVL